MIQSQQLAAAVAADATNANALTEKLKSTLQINSDSKPSAPIASPDMVKEPTNANELTSTDWNDVNEQQSPEVVSNSWSAEMESSGYRGNGAYKRNTNSYGPRPDKFSDNSYGGRTDKYQDNKYQDNKYQDNKYQDNKYQDNKYQDNKYNTFRHRAYQNGGGNRGSDSGMFFKNNSFYPSNGNNMGYRTRMSGGTNSDYNSRPPRSGPNNGPQNNRNNGNDRDNRSIKA